MPVQDGHKPLNLGNLSRQLRSTPPEPEAELARMGPVPRTRAGGQHSVTARFLRSARARFDHALMDA